MHKNFKKTFLSANESLHAALEIIDGGAIKMALIIDDNGKLLGTLTDGDIRRALLKGCGLEESIERYFHRNPITCSERDSRDRLLQLSLDNKIYHIPMIDEFGRAIGVVEIEELIRPKVHKNKVVLMVGGLGSRLGHLTNQIPKPMLNVGNRPLLETIIQNFGKCGFNEFILSVNYKSEVIQNYFGNGENFGVKIKYLNESKRLGTAGALWQLKNEINEPFFVMNGDILTNVNFDDIKKYHEYHGAFATMAVRDYIHQIPYGVLELDEEKILSINEKPAKKYFVSAGIYMLDPNVFKYIEKDAYLDMPVLFERIIKDKNFAISFPIREYWLDIGKISDYEKANSEYSEVFQA